jgi:hypothetical protein
MLRLNKGFLIISIVAITFLLFISCKKHETEKPMDVGYGYFPTNIGHWVLYDVDSTFYDDYHYTHYHYHYTIKEYIESTFLDNQNRPTQRIERYKTIDTIPTYIANVWSANLTSSNAEKVEDNIRYVKLIFPIADGQTWNGNAFNTLGEQEYKYDNVFAPYTINGLSFDSTVTVLQDDIVPDTNLIDVKIEKEIFAKNVGMIYKRYRNVHYPNTAFSPDTISGVDYTYKIISFGN